LLDRQLNSGQLLPSRSCSAGLVAVLLAHIVLVLGCAKAPTPLLQGWHLFRPENCGFAVWLPTEPKLAISQGTVASETRSKIWNADVSPDRPFTVKWIVDPSYSEPDSDVSVKMAAEKYSSNIRMAGFSEAYQESETNGVGHRLLIVYRAKGQATAYTMTAQLNNRFIFVYACTTDDAGDGGKILAALHSLKFDQPPAEKDE
jgi:hypothetical protein